jgi:hypothetical protein
VVDRWSRRTGAWAEEVEEQIRELTPVDPGMRDVGAGRKKKTEINQARSGEQLTPARRKVGVEGWLGYGIVIPYPWYEIQISYIYIYIGRY